MTEPTTAEICDCANTGPDAINTCQRVIRGRVEPPCDCDCHKPTREQMCRDLALAMGWATSDGGNGRRWLSPDTLLLDRWMWHPPDPFSDHADCHALVAWLAADSQLWRVFENKLRDLLIAQYAFERHGLWSDVRIFMTAEPAIIAEAAWRTINAAEQPKAS